MSVTTLLADGPLFLLSPWKPLLFWAVLCAWGWLVGSRLYPDALRLHQGHHGWAMIWMATGFIGFVVMLIGWMFYISFFAGIAVLLIPILIYWKQRNAAVDVSQRYHLRFRRDPAAANRRKLAKRAAANATLGFSSPAGDVPVPAKDDPLLGTWLQLEELLLPTLREGGTRIDLALSGGGLASTSMIYTVRSKQEPISGEDGMLVINLLKEIAGLDQSETRRKQHGQFTVTGDETGRHVLDVMLSGSSKGIKGRIDVDRFNRANMSIDLIGMLPEQLKVLEDLKPEEKRTGIVLVAAPLGHGSTTTGYAVTSMHDAYLSMIKTLEIQLEGRLEGVDQVDFSTLDDGTDYATQLQSILRRDPDVVLAEVRDAETAQVAARASQDSTLQVLMIRADSAATGIREWVRNVGDVPSAAKGLQAVIGQRLVRVLCPQCRQAVHPADPKQLGLEEGAVIYRATGEIEVKNRVEPCPTCKGTGYNGVTGIFEVMAVTVDIRRLLASGDLKGALAQARRDRMLLLQETGLRRVAEGITSLEEVQRVLSPPKAPAKKAGSGAREGSAT